MGVPIINTLFIFLLYQILLFGSINGLPFASISSIPSLKTAESSPKDKSPVTNAILNLVNPEDFTLPSSAQGTLSSNNFQFLIGTPNTVFISSQNPSLVESANNELSSTNSNINLLTSYNLHPNVASQNVACEPSSSIELNLNDSPTFTSAADFLFVPNSNSDLDLGNLKTESHDALSSLNIMCPPTSTSASSLTIVPIYRLDLNSDTFIGEMHNTLSISDIMSPTLTSASSLPAVPNFSLGINSGNLKKQSHDTICPSDTISITSSISAPSSPIVPVLNLDSNSGNFKRELHETLSTGITAPPSESTSAVGVTVIPNLDSDLNSGNLNTELHDTLSTDTIPPSSASELTIVQNVNLGCNSGNFKRELRDTISVLSQEPCMQNIQQNFATFSRSSSNCNCINNPRNFQSPFSSSPSPSLSNLKPIFPCVKTPVNFTQSSIQGNVVCYSQDSSNTVPFTNFPFLTNVNPCTTSIQNNLLPPQERSETSNVDLPVQSSINAQSSFADIKNYINSRIAQNQPNLETNVAPCQINQVNNNLMIAQAIQNNKMASQQFPSQTLINNQPNNNVQEIKNNADCENINKNKFAAEYENALRIRNSVIPKMLSNNVLVKNIPQNNVQNCNDNNNLGCPQLQTVPSGNNVPYIQNNNIILNPTNNCGFVNNNLGNTGFSLSLNNIARMIKDNVDNIDSQNNNNNQGCPQLMSIPVYNKESLLNKQLLRLSNNNVECSTNQNDNIQNNNNVITFSQNNQGCPQLLAVAQNNLNAIKNCDSNINVVINNQNCESAVESDNVNLNDNCNCMQTFAANENLSQALKLINLSKLNQAQARAGTIKILPYGQAKLDGQPISNNFMTLDSVPCPRQLPTSSDSCNSNNFLTIQDVPPIPFSSTPLNQFPCYIPSGNSLISTNTFLAPACSPINTSPLITNIAPSVINLSPSVPNLASMTTIEAPIINQPFVYSQDPLCNNNVQPVVTILDNLNNCPFTSNFISNSAPIQSLPQVSFINNLPSSAISLTPSISLPDNCISSISNLPSVCTSIQPATSYINPIIAANLLQSNSLSEASAIYPSLNNIVSSLTQNIISTIITKTLPSTVPLEQLPPVNPYSFTILSDSSTINSPICLDISQPVQYTVSSPLSLPRLSLPDIPVACNEYLPPVYSSSILPLTTVNSDLFCVESDSLFDSCSPFALSKTDAYYPEVSFVIPTVGSSDSSCLCGPLFMPPTSLPQSSSVIKINNTGREAKGFEQLIRGIIC